MPTVILKTNTMTMPLEKEYPILEFDPASEAVIEPTMIIPPAGLPERGVICFFREAIEQMRRDGRLVPSCTLHTETIDLPVYRTTVNETPICVIPAYSCAPGAAAQPDVGKTRSRLSGDGIQDRRFTRK
ncbi:MAG TPA: hypothetical protein DEB39_16940 [Planctomycetaceae bacterium]|nr:hypothetical protein [Planctomycetaceae bacterium]